MRNVFTFPNVLTLIRLILSPLMLPILFVYLLPLNVLWINCSLALLFVFLSLTDLFDGLLARRYAQVTSLGGILDPIADKFLAYSTLIALLTINKIYFYWVVILIGRDFFMMGLRNVALENNFEIRVSLLGKIKTVFQMFCLTFLIINPYQSLGLQGALGWNGLEFLVLAVTIALSLISAKQYYNSFIKQFSTKQEEASL